MSRLSPIPTLYDVNVGDRVACGSGAFGPRPVGVVEVVRGAIALVHFDRTDQFGRRSGTYALSQLEVVTAAR